MAITRAQQVKQLLANGGRIGFKGGADMGTVSTKDRKATAKSVSISPTGNVRTSDTKGPDPVERDTGLERARQRNITKIEKFKAKKPKINLPPFSPFTLIRKPLQTFSDFNTAGNRKFFENVIRAGKIPGLNFATVADMTDEELEQEFQDYMSDRLAGKTDAMGNPLIRGDADPTRGSEGDEMIPLPDEDESEDQESEYVNPLSLLTPRIAGTQFAADGGRIGFKGGADMGTVSTPTRTATAKSVNISPSGNVTTSRDRGPEGPKDRSTFEQTVNQRRIVNEAKKQKPSNLENMFRTASELNYLRNLIKMNPQGLGLSYFTNKIGNLLFPPAGAAEMTPEEKEQLLKDAGIESGTLDQKGYGDTIKKVIGDGTVTAGGTIPDLSNPDVLNKIAIDLGLPTQKEGFVIKEDVATPETASAIKEIQDYKRKGVGGDPTLKLSAPEIIDFYGTDGQYKGLGADEVQSIYDMVSLPGQNRFTAAGGGIASLEREAFFLGGLTKGLKKAVRGVKKLAKSPIGKAALLGAGFGLAGMGPMANLFSSGKGLAFKQLLLGGKTLPPSMGFKSKGLLGLIKANPIESIFLTSALAGLMTPKQDEDEFDIAKYYAKNQLTPSQSVRGMGSEFDFYGNQFVADGGRIGYQEGSKEPVAKKTLPLIDMDGMEKDYRETGGFVEMGRMEKADDVPARLSKNEFVFTADAVRNAGEGDIDKGAEVMYNMMKNLEAGGEVSEESQGLEGAREMFQTSQRLGEVI